MLDILILALNRLEVRKMKSMAEFDYEFELFLACLNLPISEKVLQLVRYSRSTAWVASGLSKIAAECGRRMLQNLAGVPSTLFTPLDYCSSNLPGYLPVLVSYSGRNSDIHSAAKCIVQSSIEQAILITGYEQNPVRKYLEKHGIEAYTIHLPEHKEDKRFVDVVATWALTGLSFRLAQGASTGLVDRMFPVEGLRDAYQRARQRSQTVVAGFQQVEDWTTRHWIILGGGMTVPTMLAWETMLAEGAILSVGTADIKDYTHGRYLSAFREENVGFVLLTDSVSAGIGRILERRFSTHFPVIKINTAGDQVLGLFEQLFLVTFVVSALAEALGHSLARPPKPKTFAYWTNWGRIGQRTAYSS